MADAVSAGAAEAAAALAVVGGPPYAVGHPGDPSVQPWMGDYGHFTVMPQTGALATSAADRASEYRLILGSQPDRVLRRGDFGRILDLTYPADA